MAQYKLAEYCAATAHCAPLAEVALHLPFPSGVSPLPLGARESGSSELLLDPPPRAGARLYNVGLSRGGGEENNRQGRGEAGWSIRETRQGRDKSRFLILKTGRRHRVWQAGQPRLGGPAQVSGGVGRENRATRARARLLLEPKSRALVSPSKPNPEPKSAPNSIFGSLAKGQPPTTLLGRPAGRLGWAGNAG
ncbi:hypothetical protein CSOJ01_00532 [Colletotrichum sojae]|uniref:Uncharacterized protein n=1 Tax=Colletotrichum sojae TaxID=2175907 RepID=A0A8H6JXV2_9PEZI|nr:hypothetical protein CSOJ01_00532 [Colletotrichum sojae]